MLTLKGYSHDYPQGLQKMGGTLVAHTCGSRGGQGKSRISQKTAELVSHHQVICLWVDRANFLAEWEHKPYRRLCLFSYGKKGKTSSNTTWGPKPEDNLPTHSKSSIILLSLSLQPPELPPKILYTSHAQTLKQYTIEYTHFKQIHSFQTNILIDKWIYSFHRWGNGGKRGQVL